MIWFSVREIFDNHEKNWIPDLNNCEDMQPDNPHMLDNQKHINDYIRHIERDNSLSNFEKYCAVHLMSLEMSVWCKKNHIYIHERKNYYKTVSYTGDKYIWDPDRNADGSDKDYIDQLNFAYEFVQYSSIPNTMALDTIGYVYDDDFKLNVHGTQKYLCMPLYRFFKILHDKFGFHIKQSPFNSNALIAYYFSEDNKATLLRSAANSVEFFENDYDILINKIYNSCVNIQKSL